MNRTTAEAQKIFLQALEHEPSRRQAYVEAVCASNPALRLEIESLLRAHEQAGNFLGKIPPSQNSILE